MPELVRPHVPLRNHARDPRALSPCRGVAGSPTGRAFAGRGRNRKVSSIASCRPAVRNRRRGAFASSIKERSPDAEVDIELRLGVQEPELGLLTENLGVLSEEVCDLPSTVSHIREMVL